MAPAWKGSRGQWRGARRTPRARRPTRHFTPISLACGPKLDAPGMEYYTLHDGNPAVAGVVQIDQQSATPPHWMVYFSVDSLTRADAVWQQHGGTFLEGPLDSPYGKIMLVRDAQGAVMSYIA